jgi:hypothetical protein
MRKNLPTRAQQITIPPSSITLSNRPLSNPMPRVKFDKNITVEYQL